MALDNRVPLDMHPDRLTEQSRLAMEREFERIGVNPPRLDEDETLQAMHRAASGLYQTLSELYSRLDKVDQDSTRTDGDKVRLKGQIRDKHAPTPTKRLEAARRDAQVELNKLDETINQGLKDRLSYEEGREIRDFVRSHTKPLEFLQKAAQQGDTTTLAAVLSHRSYLSGLTDDQQAQLREFATATAFPEETARRERLSAALERLESNANLYVSAQSTMVDSHEAQRLERERAEAEAALNQPLSATVEVEPEEGVASEGVPE